jgi:hypothetical protein
MLVRVSPKVRGAIEREAQRSGRSLSAQAEAIVLEAALERSRRERKSRALAYLVTQAGKVMQAAARNEGAEFDWQTARRGGAVTLCAISDAGRPRPDRRRNRAGDRDPRQGAGARARGLAQRADRLAVLRAAAGGGGSGVGVRGATLAQQRNVTVDFPQLFVPS